MGFYQTNMKKKITFKGGRGTKEHIAFGTDVPNYMLKKWKCLHFIKPHMKHTNFHSK